MPLTTHCTGCRVRLTFGDDRAGTTQPCPKCHTPVAVPSGPTTQTPQPSKSRIEFLCPFCSARLSIAGRKAGAEANCPKCSQPVIVPTPNVSPQTGVLIQPPDPPQEQEYEPSQPQTRNEPPFPALDLPPEGDDEGADQDKASGTPRWQKRRAKRRRANYWFAAVVAGVFLVFACAGGYALLVSLTGRKGGDEGTSSLRRKLWLSSDERKIVGTWSQAMLTNKAERIEGTITYKDNGSFTADLKMAGRDGVVTRISLEGVWRLQDNLLVTTITQETWAFGIVGTDKFTPASETGMDAFIGKRFEGMSLSEHVVSVSDT